MEIFPTNWHEVINDTTLVDDPEDRVSVRSWKEFFMLLDKDFSEDKAAKLIFGSKAEDIIDAVMIAKATDG